MVVVKQGTYDNMKEEYDIMNMLDHPNISHAYRLIDKGAPENGCEVAYLAMRRLGPSLKADRGSEWPLDFAYFFTA